MTHLRVSLLVKLSTCYEQEIFLLALLEDTNPLHNFSCLASIMSIAAASSLCYSLHILKVHNRVILTTHGTCVLLHSFHFLCISCVCDR